MTQHAEEAMENVTTADPREDSFFHIAIGGMAAIALGGVLTPLRELTSASNLAFAFVLLTIAIGELGGRAAALVTAVVSALSLNFFLTRPYLTLTIHDKDDVIAFFGLAACGLLAAAFSSGRGRRRDALRTSRAALDLLQAAARALEGNAPTEADLKRLLDTWRAALPVAALVVRDTRGYVLGATDGAYGNDVPPVILAPESLLPATAGSTTRRGTQPLPREGGRLVLSAHGTPVGALDVWGDGRLADPAARRTRSALARLLAATLRPPTASFQEAS
jgi:hypothetical protein